MRRFAFIEVASPRPTVFDELIDSAAGSSELAGQLTREFLPLRKLKDLGPAIFMDMARYLGTRAELDDAPRSQLAFEAFYSYLLPQFEGISELEGGQLFRRVLQLVGRQHEDRLRDTLRSVLGLELRDTAAAIESEADVDGDDTSPVASPELQEL